MLNYFAFFNIDVVGFMGRSEVIFYFDVHLAFFFEGHESEFFGEIYLS